MSIHQHEIRVIFGDTDQMGVVYYANYYRYFEAARASFLRWMGKSNDDLNRWNIALPVSISHCAYKNPSFYEDLLTVDSWISDIRRASFQFDYKVKRGEELLAEGYTVHVSVDQKTLRPIRLPDEFRVALEKTMT